MNQLQFSDCVQTCMSCSLACANCASACLKEKEKGESKEKFTKAKEEKHYVALLIIRYPAG